MYFKVKRIEKNTNKYINMNKYVITCSTVLVNDLLRNTYSLKFINNVIKLM